MQKGYSVNVNGAQLTAIVNDGQVSCSEPVQEPMAPIKTIEFEAKFPHTGLPTGSAHVFHQYPDGTILGTHGGNLLTKQSNKAEVNSFLRKHNVNQKF